LVYFRLVGVWVVQTLGERLDDGRVSREHEWVDASRPSLPGVQVGPAKAGWLRRRRNRSSLLVILRVRVILKWLMRSHF
jgi:hypothetical protein